MPREPFSACTSPIKGRPRWTPQLLKAFEDAAAALGPQAAPAAVLEHMGPAAAGLTRDAVAAHLQKQRSGVLRSGSRKSLDGRRSLDASGLVGCGGLKALRTLSVPNLGPRPCRRSPRTPKTAKAAAGLHSEQAQAPTDSQGCGAAMAVDADDGSGVGCGMDPAWRLPPAQPPAQWCLGPTAAVLNPAAAALNPGGWPAAAAAAHSWAPWPLQGSATVTTGAFGVPLGGPVLQAPTLQGGTLAAPDDSPGSGSASSTALADGSAHAAEAAAAAMAAAALAVAMAEDVPAPSPPQPPAAAQSLLDQRQPAAADRAATHSPEGCGAAACGFGAAFDAAADTSFELLGGLSASEDSDTELWSMAELTAAALSIPPEVLAEADLLPLLPDAAASSAVEGPPAGIASAGSGAWDAAFGTAAGLPPLRTTQSGSPMHYAPLGATPPPFRGASATLGAAGFAAGGPASKLHSGTPQQLLQGGPGRLACISAPAACMQSAAAWDAVHYAARHAHMLQDLRCRPTQPPIGLKLDKESVLEELRAAAG